ncbi:uncharacterized protein K452DRAFT_286542 [Aplosporella prunicola CBS 121167]|uniref:Wings apart-like protein C-terminal domain-containing protein n=1 Tax=Aplosporella prunicola CBS 121167 TaxID=1176127 RepID=A0A6A6BK33_9PEZI|nr:uncharacterized protein K452DRAFT_286542 [Aplosporella prunicola CBS 121167]KAF2142911.1 hypothetical protein K452DRAFT_286542 [Aplosporella prunicola CBS 121167]
MDFPQRRRKISTYGKASRTTNYTLNNDIGSPEKPRTTKPIWKSRAAQRSVSEKQDGGAEQPPARTFAVFDVPSSEDERPSVAKAPAKPRLPTGSSSKTSSNKRSSQTSEDSASEQLRNEIAAAEIRMSPQKTTPESKDEFDGLTQGKSTSLLPNNQRTNADGRRRKAAVGSAQAPDSDAASELRLKKRPHSVTELSVDEAGPASAAQKRSHKSLKSKRNASALHKDSHVKTKVPSTFTAETLEQTKMRKPMPILSASANAPKEQSTSQATKKPDVKRSGDLANKSEAAPATRAVSLEKPRRTYGASSKARLPMQKGKSVPSLLQTMLPSTESKPSIPPEPEMSRMSPPDLDEDLEVDLPSTPPRRTSQSPFGTVTPRQNQAWSNLLDETATSSSSRLSLDDLQLHTVKPRRTQLLRTTPDFLSTRQSSKARLIDTLKQDASVDSEEEDGDDSLYDYSDVLPKKPLANSSQSLSGGTRGNTKAASQGTASTFSQEASSSQAIPIAAGPKLTYARTRSYLNEDSLEDALNIPLPMDISPMKAGSRGKGQSGYFSGSQDDDLEDSQSGMRNIHELRAAGGARRMVDDIENLLDDIEAKKANSMSRRRSALLELCLKLTDKAYIGRMVDHGLDHRLFSTCAAATDTVLSFATAAAVIFFVMNEAPPSALNEIYQSGISERLTSLLSIDADINQIAKERKTNMSKVAKNALADFRNQVAEQIWLDEAPEVVSPLLIGLKSIELLVRRLRENGNKADLLGYEICADVSQLAKLPSEKLAANSATKADITLLDLVISTLESASINVSVWSGSGTDPAGSISQVAKSITSILSTDTAQYEQLEVLALRLTLNLTNNNPKICEMFSTPLFVQSMVRSIDTRCQLLHSHLDEEEHIKTLDRLVLSLGTMINLAEFNDQARISVTSDDDELLHSLVRSFASGIEKAEQADSVEESQSGVAYGYLAVLLGNMCLNDSMREKIRSQLPNKRMDILVRAVEQFIFVHQKVDRESLQDGEEGRELWANFTARLQAVVQRLKQSEFD